MENKAQKEVILQSVTIKPDRAKRLDALCDKHRVGIEHEWSETTGKMHTTLILTEDSVDLPLFARHASMTLDGEPTMIAALVRDFSTLGDPFPKHILIIEDDTALQKTYERQLKRYCHTTIVDRSAVAITYLEAIQFDVVLCDFHLHGGDSGKRVYDWISKNRTEMLKQFWFISGSDEVYRIHYNILTKGTYSISDLHELILK